MLGIGIRREYNNNFNLLPVMECDVTVNGAS